MGMVYYQFNEDNFNQALKTSQLNDEKKLESDILMNISTHYASINMYSVAMNYLMTAQAIKFEMGDTVGAGMLLNNIGTIHISLENFEKKGDASTAFSSVNYLSVAHTFVEIILRRIKKTLKTTFDKPKRKKPKNMEIKYKKDEGKKAAKVADDRRQSWQA